MVDYRPHGTQELVESPKSCETSEYSFLSAIKYQSQPSSKQPKSRTELTQSYRRSNSEEEEKRAPIREVGANHAANAWAALCSWTLWKFSVMVLCWSHSPGRDPPGTHCVLLARLPSAEVMASLKVSSSIWKPSEHSSLSYISLCFLPTS